MASPPAAPSDRDGPPAGAGLLVAGGLLGLMGVAVSAAASHRGGGELAATAGTFLLLHAAAVMALASWVRQAARPRLLVAAGWTLSVGVSLFAADLAAAGLWGQRPFPPAAPIGGTLMLIGWATVVVGGALAARSRP